MAEKILVALDHSPMSDRVFQDSLKLAQALGAELLLVHVLSSGSADSPKLPTMPILDYYPSYNASAMEVFEQAWQAYEQKGQAMLDRLQATAAAAGLTVQARQVQGAAGAILCREAKDFGATLIVMGRRGHSGLSELLLGSVSNYVLHHAPCSIYVINAVPEAQPLPPLKDEL
ncbi:universal stress protein [Lyngbya confervoides]|uniref:Universal stress protein n=1 Tax=Lyngbya confervoides BDU141951 TaxID=1574623 RepID=A0ABD4T2L4_9CYAN|nr:universal stress protein [Lyngbya confervoides]MCM1982733.1 universal stress protein [Lyngbya confervoides BDU141951]